MATVVPTIIFGEGRTMTWTPLTETNADGTPAVDIGSGDRCFQATGTFGAGGTILLQGSLDGTNWYGLKDPAGAAISLTAAGLRQVLENPRYVRPFISAGTGVSITAILFTRKLEGNR
jgi:hypothetical protein